MRILITGHLGYVGPVVVRRLIADGHDLVGLDCGYFRECLTGGSPPPEINPDLLRDIRDVVPSDLEGIDAIVHLAGLSNDPLGAIAPELTAEINHQATIRLARMARAAGVGRFVFASSCSVYGAADGGTALDETAPLNPVSAYAVSKAACERDLLDLADERFSPVFLRFATAFGVSARTRLDLVLNNLTAWAFATGTIRVLSDGQPWRPLVHLEDMALAFSCAAVAPANAIHGRAFNIGHPANNLRVAEIAAVVAAQVPGSVIEITGETRGDPRSYRVDVTRALTELPGFAPRWTVAMGCAELVSWMTAAALRATDIDGETYVRLKRLLALRKSGRIGSDLRLVDQPSLRPRK